MRYAGGFEMLVLLGRRVGESAPTSCLSRRGTARIRLLPSIVPFLHCAVVFCRFFSRHSLVHQHNPRQSSSKGSGNAVILSQRRNRLIATPLPFATHILTYRGRRLLPTSSWPDMGAACPSTQLTRTPLDRHSPQHKSRLPHY
jgi:hypothetical protein